MKRTPRVRDLVLAIRHAAGRPEAEIDVIDWVARVFDKDEWGDISEMCLAMGADVAYTAMRERMAECGI